MIKSLLTLALILAVTLSVTVKVNKQKLLNDPPKLISQVPNGQKYIIGSLDDPSKNYLYIANLKGTPAQMGQAYGQLFKQQLKQMVPMFYDYYTKQLQKLITDNTKIPNFLADKLTKGTVSFGKRLLDLNVMITKKYTNKRYYQQINGIAKGSKLSAKEFARLNIVPEIIKAACTVAGIWGKASAGGKTLHVRALDWDYQNPISKFPLVAIYHPSNPKWQTHANFAWVGLIGSMTGMSTKVSLGQKVWLPKKGSVQMTRYGNPWTYVFRDVLYEAVDISSALRILSETHRTCAIHIGLASVADRSFRMLQYAEKDLFVFDDKNYSYTNAHPKIQNIAYFDKHVQPSGNGDLGQLFSSASTYGNWTLDSVWRTVGLTHQTGDAKLAVFSLQDQQAYVSYSEYNGTKKAFERSPIYLNMGELFKPF